MQREKDQCQTARMKNELSFHFINLLDKCKQILRDDKIQIRNQIKAGDQETIQIFNMYKKSQDLQQLQIKLRKHITNLKKKTKLQQLSKLKQNFTVTQSITDNPKSHNIRLSYANKDDWNSSINKWNSSINKSLTNLNVISSPSLINLRTNSQRNLTYSQSKPKLTSSINMQQKHYRKKSQDKISVIFRKTANRHNERIFKVEGHKKKQFKIQRNTQNLSLKQNIKKQIDKFSLNSSQQYNKQQSSFVCVEQYLDVSIYKNGKMANQWSPQDTLFYESQIKQNNTNQKDQNIDSIFTPSQLLKQCRNFIKQNKISNQNQQQNKPIDNNIPKSMVIDESDYYNLDTSSLTSNHLNFSNFEVEKIQSSSVSELIYENNVVKNEKFFNITPEQQHKIYQSKCYDRQTRARTYSQLQHFNTKRNTAQQVIDYIQYNIKNGFILLNSVLPVLPSDLLWEFKQKFVSSNDQIAIQQLGEFLQNKMAKSEDNSVKYFQSVVDIDKKGYSTLKDIEDLIEKLKSNQIGQDQQIPQKLMKIYNICCHSDGKLYYWNIYTIKNSSYFLDVCSILYKLNLKLQC